MNVRDMKANKNPFFTQDHELLGNTRSTVQTAAEIPTPITLILLKNIYFCIYFMVSASSYLALHYKGIHYTNPIR